MPELFLSCGGELRDVEEEFSEYVRYCYGLLFKFSFFSLSESLSMSIFLNLLFERIANSNAYLLAKIGFDTAENEPCKACLIDRFSSPAGRSSSRASRPGEGRAMGWTHTRRLHGKLGCRSGELDRARSRLYRGQILQVNMRLKARVNFALRGRL